MSSVVYLQTTIVGWGVHAVSIIMKTPFLVTERLILRPIKACDLDIAYKKWFTDLDVARYMFWGPHNDIARTTEWMNYELQMTGVSNWYRFIVCNKMSKEDTPCGSILFYFDDEITDWEIAYHFEKESWGRGYATESVRAVLSFARNDLRIDHVFARYADKNVSSGKVLSKTGFIKYQSIDYWCNDHKTRVNGWLCKCDL